jgi:hypothetical protein
MYAAGARHIRQFELVTSLIPPVHCSPHGWQSMAEHKPGISGIFHLTARSLSPGPSMPQAEKAEKTGIVRSQQVE